MAQTVIRGTQILNNTVQRQDLDTSTVGQAVVTKLVQGSGITLSSTGADSGTGDVTVSAAVPIADNTQSGLLRQVSGNTTDFIDGTNNSQALQPVIWSVRLRSFNAIGNPTFEVDQKNIGAAVANPSALLDRWFFNKTGTMAFNSQQVVPGVLPLISGNFLISHNALNLTLATQQASLGAGDYAFVSQVIEGPRFRELSQDVHSLSLLVYSSVANLKFSAALRDALSAKSLVKLCTIPNANTWTMISLPSLPLWMSGGTFNYAPGTAGYILSICLAAGATFTAPATDIWATGNYIAAAAADNFASKPVSSQFLIALVQHEPGALVTTPEDCPWQQNYDDCLRYFSKTYSYATAIPTNTFNGSNGSFYSGQANSANGYGGFPKTMAKVPTVVAYGPTTGGANNAYRGSDGTIVAATPALISDRSFLQLQGSSTIAAGTNYVCHFVADTGW